MVLDAHQHFWQRSLPFNYEWLKSPSLAKINRDFLPDDLEPLLRAAGVKQSIFVQTQHNVAENRWALGLAEKHAFIAGIVGWVDLQSPDCDQQLLEFKDHPKFVGVRHVTQDEPDNDFIIRPEVIRGLRVLEKHGVPFDLLFYVKHLHHVPEIARQVPNLPMVIDHLAKPEIKSQRMDNWLPNLKAAAKIPTVFCKLSGLITEADWQNWKVSDLRPYIDAAFEHFGPERCMFGSDWPVCELAGSYQQVFDVMDDMCGSLSYREEANLFGETARRFYRL
jgi:L-fuconolactonase